MPFAFADSTSEYKRWLMDRLQTCCTADRRHDQNDECGGCTQLSARAANARPFNAFKNASSARVTSAPMVMPLCAAWLRNKRIVLGRKLHAYARRIYVTAFRTFIGLSILWPADPAVPPLSASCASRQRFASGFLPTPGHPGNRCLPLTLAHVGCGEGFHLQEVRPAGRTKKSPAGGGASNQLNPEGLRGICISD
jgi:hypothetical protein